MPRVIMANVTIAEWRERALAAESQLADLRSTAWWVVMHWDAEKSQHGTMGRLRVLVGLPPDRPTREEAQKRLDEHLRDPSKWHQPTEET